MNNTVLIVDDDSSVLETYQTILMGTKWDSNTTQMVSELEEAFAIVDEKKLPSSQPLKVEEYQLQLASSGEMAIQLHAEALTKGGRIAVALLDMRMPPGINGLQTAIALRKQDPSINIVIITAYSDYDIDQIQDTLQYDFILLSKPVDSEEFRQITRNAIISFNRFNALKHSNDFSFFGEREDAPKVLVVDNGLVTQQYCAGLLERYGGYQVYLANSGEQALEKVGEVQPDLILLDVIMPGLNGYETCARLKADPEFSDIPVVFITARSEDQDMIEGFKVGGEDYVTKPFSQELLLARVSIRVKQYRLRSRRETISENRLLKVMSSLNEGMVVTDRQGIVTEVNSVVSRMTRLPYEKLIGRQFSTLFSAVRNNEQGLALDEEGKQQLQQRLQSLLEQHPLYFKQLIDDAPLGIIQLNAETQQITSLNYYMLQLLKQQVGALEGESIDTVLPNFSALNKEGQSTEEPFQLNLPQNSLPQNSLTQGEVGGLPVMVSRLQLKDLDGIEQWVVIVRQQEYEMDQTLMQLTGFGQLYADKDKPNEWSLKQRDGGTLPVTLQGGVYRNQHHLVEGGVITLMDLRERKKLESQNQYVAFQTGVAEMSANILHNIGNSAQGIATGISQLKQQQKSYQELIEGVEHFNQLDLDQKERSRREHTLVQELPSALRKIMAEEGNTFSELSSVELVDHGVQHISEIIQLHRLGFKLDQQATYSDLYQLLDDALMLTGGQLSKHGIELKQQLNLEQGGCLVPRNQLLQALINLIANAMEAVVEQFSEKRGGVVIIQLSQFEENGGAWISIMVEDNGVGISAQQQQQIFKFGYSTKQRGSGFGLHATAHFLRGIGGRIEVESEGKGCGTRFWMKFPIRLSGGMSGSKFSPVEGSVK
ncbi:MAG: response regulator [Gammaproteobacteria bacterium]|nr:response regulator [Gammaproteobacteria bacterium]